MMKESKEVERLMKESKEVGRGMKESRNNYKINNIIEHTTNNIHQEVADLARKYVDEREINQSIKDSIQEGDDDVDLLIGISDRTPLGSDVKKEKKSI